MRLNLQTDYALRLLMMLATKQDFVSIGEIAKRFRISKHHLTKVAQQLATGGYITTLRGRGGGVRLMMPTTKIKVGAVVRHMENDLGVVLCLEQDASTSSSLCMFLPGCKLKRLLSESTASFLAVLDAKTLADLVQESKNN
ncbi:MAG: Rrf2 family transcriptional regulator [Aestuariivirga sp.]